MKLITDPESVLILQSVGVLFSAIGAYALAKVAIRSPEALRVQLSPTIDELGLTDEKLERARANTRLSAFGYVVLSIGLMTQVAHHFLTTSFTWFGLLLIGGSSIVILAGIYWQTGRIADRYLGWLQDQHRSNED